MTTKNQDLINQVKHVIESLENPAEYYCQDCGLTCDNEECECGNTDLSPITAYDYLNDTLEINWVLNNDKTYKGATVLVALGGPNIWIDTVSNEVQGYWWSDSYSESFCDNIGLDDALEELFNC